MEKVDVLKTSPLFEMLSQPEAVLEVIRAGRGNVVAGDS